MLTFLKILDKLYVVKRLLSWLFHTINLGWLLHSQAFRNRYSNAYGYTVYYEMPSHYSANLGSTWRANFS